MHESDTVYYRRPWQSTAEDRMTATLQTLSGQVGIGPWQPPRPCFGVHGPRKHNLTIDDVVRIDVVYPRRRIDFTGSPGAYSATSTPALGVM